MTETENGDTTPLKPKKREGSRLDRGFPMGIILLIILGLVFFFQIISAWKIINLEREKTEFETDKQNYGTLKFQELPELQRIMGELKDKQQKLQSEEKYLEEKLAKTKDVLNKTKQKSEELKLDNEMQEEKLERTRSLVQEARKAKAQVEKDRDHAMIKRNEWDDKARELTSKIKEDQSRKAILEKKISEREKEIVNLESEIEHRRKNKTELEVRIETRKDELQKLLNAQNANNLLTGIISELRETADSLDSTTKTIEGSSQSLVKSQSDFNAKFEKAVKGLKNTTSNISSSAQKFDDAINNLKNEKPKLEEMTTDFRAKLDQIDLSTKSLNKNVGQLFTMRDDITNLSTKIIELSNSAETELKAYKETHAKLEKLSVQIIGTTESLSADSLVLRDTLNKLMEDERNAVQGLNSATRNFSNIVSQMDDSKSLLSSIVNELYSKYEKLDSIKLKQEEIVSTQNAFLELVRRIGATYENLEKDRVNLMNTFDQIRNDLSSAIEGVKDLKDNIREVEKKVESLNTGTKKPNEKEEE